MDITVIDSPASEPIDASVPGSITARRVVARLVEFFDLPTVDEDGDRVVYVLHDQRSGMRLSDDDSLEHSGVREGAVLRVTEVGAAG